MISRALGPACASSARVRREELLAMSVAAPSSAVRLVTTVRLVGLVCDICRSLRGPRVCRWTCSLLKLEVIRGKCMKNFLSEWRKVLGQIVR